MPKKSWGRSWLPCLLPSCADMAARRIGYLAALLAAVVFFWAYREWLSWMLLMLTVFLPWFSLLVSLPAMFTFRVEVSCPKEVPVGTEVQGTLSGVCSLPAPPFRGKLQLESYMTGSIQKLRRHGQIPTDHSGGFLLTPRRVWVYDYLGLLAFPVTRKQS